MSQGQDHYYQLVEMRSDSWLMRRQKFELVSAVQDVSQLLL